ncbi:coiled-coil domain-containing protein 25 isoform X8 [Globicephala melas]|uniref:coiled-coil domain-containing protein 25 isoform X8 n=1 Tax=Globicephala melas TaxID=9731 RepID=UPI00293D6AEA|nr:coiled-coil domain-containing protein 25 isoform X8 [Globicephala melas]
MLRSEEDCLCCCKMNNVNVVYTPWSNLKKTADMDVGQIGFHRQKDVKIVTVEKKVNEILNRLEKTKMERFPDLEAEKECRDREERNEKKAQIQEMKRKEKEEMKKKREMDELRSYSSLMKVENMSSNQFSNSIERPPPLRQVFNTWSVLDLDQEVRTWRESEATNPLKQGRHFTAEMRRGQSS